MGLLTFSINITLDGCVDHQEGIADETRDHSTVRRKSSLTAWPDQALRSGSASFYLVVQPNGYTQLM